MITVAISSQIVVKTAAQWALDATVYSAKRILVTSDVTYGNGVRKIKIADGTNAWSALNYFPGADLATVGAIVLTGFAAGANSSILATDTIAQALAKIQGQINARVVSNASIGADTKTKITYDSKGLVTSGADATTADIADSLNKRYVTDANIVVIGNTSGTNTGDQDLSGKANLASPTFTGTPAAPTAASGTNTTQLATTAFVQDAVAKQAEVIGLACSDETTALTTGTAKITFRMPFAMTLTVVRASLSTTQTSGSILTVDINEGGTTILSTKLTIDNGEKTSTTAATAPVISDTSLADDAEITVDIDQVGDGTAKGLKIWLIGTRT